MKYLFFFLSLIGLVSTAASQPNIIIVITDDQGYGDLSCHGNPYVKTPHIDKFYEDSVRLTNYHVDPTCAPTRSALMTGRYSARVGVWHTVQGRHLMRERETTMADILQDNGYATGIFGKWHLGDAYPYRPEDRGFTHVVSHGAGGVGQAPDYWGNDYFNDTYYVNGEFKKFEGFCSDVFFSEGIKFMKTNIDKKKPFMAYITTNAPHGPFRAPQKYLDMYNKIPALAGDVAVPFYGMITNIDDNFGTLRSFLKSEGVEDNTIVIYTTDNGSSAGSKFHNSGMRGGKGSNTDGGHRVPFIVRWPKGMIKGGKDVDQLTAHLDILPTFIDYLNLKSSKIDFDGTSLKALIQGDKNALRDRTLMVESQRIKDPDKWRNTAVMTDRWRLLNDSQLFDIRKDPAQQNNVAEQHPEVMQQLRATYDKMWASLAAEHAMFSPLVIGSEHENPVVLTSHDQMVETGLPCWSQGAVLKGKNKLAPWVVRVEHEGEYEISIRRWAAELDKGINDKYRAPQSLDAVKAFCEIGGQKLELMVPEGAKEVTFKLHLKPGQQNLVTGFEDSKGTKASAFYAYVLNKNLFKGQLQNWQTREGLGLPQTAEYVMDYPAENNTYKKKKFTKKKPVKK